MKFSRYRFSGFFIAAVFLSSSPAMAGAPQVQFHPVKPWVEENIGGPSGTPICTVRSEYNNGFVLQFAASGRGLEMMAVNFRQDIFQDGQAYPVKISVEGGAVKNLTAKARGAGQLNIGLNGDREFLNTLRSAPSIDMQIEDNHFRFFLVGLQDVAGDLGSCAASAVPAVSRPAVQAPARAALTPSPVLEQKSVASLPQPRTQDDDLPAVAAHVPLAPPVVSNNHLPQEEITPYKATRAEGIFSAAQEGGDGARTSIDAPALPKTPSPAAKPVVATEEIKWNSLPPSATIATVEPPPPPKIESKNFTSPEPKVTRDVRRGEFDMTQYDRPDPAPVSYSQKTLKDVEAPVDTGMKREMALKISELEQKVATLKRENEMLDQDLKNNVSASVEEKTSIASGDWNLEKATMRYQEAEREIKRLGMKLQQERAHCDTEKKDIEGMLFDPRVTEEQQMARLAELENKLAGAEQVLADQRMRYEERIKILEERLGAR